MKLQAKARRELGESKEVRRRRKNVMKGSTLGLLIAREGGESTERLRADVTRVGAKQDNDKTRHAIKKIKQGTSDVIAFNVMQQPFNAHRLLRRRN